MTNGQTHTQTLDKEIVISCSAMHRGHNKIETYKPLQQLVKHKQGDKQALHDRIAEARKL